MKKRALVRVTFELLAEAIGLSHDESIIEVFQDNHGRQTDTFIVKISGNSDRIPFVTEGEMLQFISVGK